jgi:hypothetical protein
MGVNASRSGPSGRDDLRAGRTMAGGGLIINRCHGHRLCTERLGMEHVVEFYLIITGLELIIAGGFVSMGRSHPSKLNERKKSYDRSGKTQRG